MGKKNLRRDKSRSHDREKRYRLHLLLHLSQDRELTPRQVAFGMWKQRITSVSIWEVR